MTMTDAKMKLNMRDNTTRLSVMSLNINGLSNEKKREKTYLRKFKIKIQIQYFYKKHTQQKKILKNGKKNGMGNLFGILEKQLLPMFE